MIARIHTMSLTCFKNFAVDLVHNTTLDSRPQRSSLVKIAPYPTEASSTQTPDVGGCLADLARPARCEAFHQ